MKTLSDEIKEFLEVTGKTQTELARASGVPQPTICALLSGRRLNVTYLTADKLRSAMSRETENGR